jgi:hypothetical protein
MAVRHPSAPATPARARFRFSLKKLLILVAVVCLYLGCWFPTATSGVRHVNAKYSVQSAPKTPLLLVRDVYEQEIQQQGTPLIARIVTRRTRTYYFWFFGWSAELFTATRFS